MGSHTKFLNDFISISLFLATTGVILINFFGPIWIRADPQELSGDLLVIERDQVLGVTKLVKVVLGEQPKAIDIYTFEDDVDIRDIQVDSQGNYVTLDYRGKLTKITPGAQTRVEIVYVFEENAGPIGLSIDKHGNYIVCEYENDKLVKIIPGDPPSREIICDKIGFPIEAITSPEGYYYVISDNGFLTKVIPREQPIRIFLYQFRWDLTGNPSGIAIDEDGCLIVTANSWKRDYSSLSKINPNIIEKNEIGVYSSPKEEIFEFKGGTCLQDIIVDPTGSYLVADSLKCEILRVIPGKQVEFSTLYKANGSCSCIAFVPSPSMISAASQSLPGYIFLALAGIAVIFSLKSRANPIKALSIIVAMFLVIVILQGIIIYQPSEDKHAIEASDDIESLIKRELVIKILSEKLENGIVPDYHWPNYTTNKIILSDNLINDIVLPEKINDLEVFVLNVEEIQAKADEGGDFIYLKFVSIDQFYRGEVFVNINNLWAVSRGEDRSYQSIGVEISVRWPITSWNVDPETFDLGIVGYYDIEN